MIVSNDYVYIVQVHNEHPSGEGKFYKMREGSLYAYDTRRRSTTIDRPVAVYSGITQIRSLFSNF